MNYNIIHSVGNQYIEDLMDLYRTTWWANTRKKKDVMKLLDCTTAQVGIVDIENDSLIGFTRAISDQVYKAAIFDVIIHPNYQGQGLGKALMESILNHPLVKTVEHIELYCLEDKLAFYEKMGFQNMNHQIKFVRLGET